MLTCCNILRCRDAVGAFGGKHGAYDGLLDYARAGGQAEAITVVDGEALLARVCDALQVAVTESGAVITHGPLPTVQGDATRIGQVLQNLIGNALKFCGQDLPRIHVSAQREGQ